MAHVILMYRMMPDASPEGMVMVADGALSVGKEAQCIKEAMECLTDSSVDLIPVYPVPGHPVMWLDAGFVDLVSLFLFLSLLPRPTHLYFWALSA